MSRATGSGPITVILLHNIQKPKKIPSSVWVVAGPLDPNTDWSKCLGKLDYAKKVFESTDYDIFKGAYKTLVRFFRGMGFDVVGDDRTVCLKNPP